jgi:hypothetical protein
LYYTTHQRLQVAIAATVFLEAIDAVGITLTNVDGHSRQSPTRCRQ